jgi:Fe2+ transport system protein B
VLNDGTRLNVIDHGKQDMIIADAKTLSSLLDVPVWDATSG